MRNRFVEFVRTQEGWLCRIGFTIATSRQFSDEEAQVEVHRKGRGWWTVLKVWWLARWQQKFYRRVHQARPYERLAKGWSE